MRQEQKWSPEDGRSNAKVIFEVTGGSAEDGLGAAEFVDPRIAKTGVGVLVVAREIETVFDEGSAGKRIITNAVAAHPGIDKGKGQKKAKEQEEFGFAGARRTCRAEVLHVHRMLSRLAAPLRPK